MTFEKLPAVDGGIACWTCGAGAKSDLAMDKIIAVGFGSAGYAKDGKTLWKENGYAGEKIVTVQEVEDMAAAEPDHDWRIFYYAPLYEAEYQRQGKARWLLIHKGNGFA